MNDIVFRECIAMLSAYFGYKLPCENGANIYAMYWSMLKHIDDDTFRRASKNIVTSWRPTSQCPFPLVSDFLCACGMSDDQLASRAVAIVKHAAARVGDYASVDFEDLALHATINKYGGWATVSRWTETEWGFNETKFISSYIAARKSGEVGPEYLHGICDTYNSANGFDKFVKKPVKISYVDGKIMISNKPQQKLVTDENLPVLQNKQNG